MAEDESERKVVSILDLKKYFNCSALEIKAVPPEDREELKALLQQLWDEADSKS